MAPVPLHSVLAEMHASSLAGSGVQPHPVPTNFGVKSLLQRSDPIQQYLDAKQKSVDAIDGEWARGLSQLEDNWQRVKVLQDARSAAWKPLHDDLERACERLRDSLDNTDMARHVCEQAQNEPGSGLPGLFTKRARDPKRFKSFQRGAILGCAMQLSDGSLMKIPCECPDGTEESGCADGRDPANHQLYCTAAFNTPVINDALRFFAQGGPCRISDRTDINERPVPVGTLPKAASASALAFLAPFLQAPAPLPAPVARKDAKARTKDWHL